MLSPRRRIETHTQVTRPSGVPELLLHLATPQTPLWSASEEQAAAWGFVEPYWAFCWAGGQALARHVLEHAAAFEGRRVLDFGAGGGVAGLAAARVGARVVASEVDPLALEALRMNAELNGAALELAGDDLLGREALPFDVVLVGDVTYESELARRVVGWLRRLTARGTLALLGDPRRGHLDESELELVATYPMPSDNDRDGSLLVPTGVYRVR